MRKIREVHHESLQNSTCWNPRCRLAYRNRRGIGYADDEYDEAGSSIVCSDGRLSSSPPLAWSTASSASLETASQLSEPLLAWSSPGLVRPSPAPSPLSASSLLLSPKRGLLHRFISAQNCGAPARVGWETLPCDAARTAFDECARRDPRNGVSRKFASAICGSPAWPKFFELGHDSMEKRLFG
ncbi:hypothetical protein GA0061102_1009155 [Rhizobium miluonense]|uniref:Uncharacterized protein n=1 Tax=Rhizobium miluonense TaxID=411945 RepID=A0A1C3V8G8_9HYPH|nr:hypothetical protein GA0061102_1009155 [Rhizobium miluonense]